MFTRAVARAPRTAISFFPAAGAARRGFQTTRAQLKSPYHYPEGPYSNIPFDPRKRFFALKYWGFMATGFGLPFLIAIWQTKKPKN